MKKRVFGFWVAAIVLFTVQEVRGADPCLGPRGDSTFTPKELLELVRVEEVKTTDGHEHHYRTTWTCNEGLPVKLLVSGADLPDVTLTTTETLSRAGSPISKKGNPFRHWVTRVHLGFELRDAVKNVDLDGTAVAVRIAFSVRLSENSTNPDDAPDVYRIQRQHFRTLHDTVGGAGRDEFQMVLETRAKYFWDSGEICPISGETNAFNTIYFYEPTSVMIGGEKLW